MLKNLEAFLAFTQERESIRLKRERGEPAPWTTDPVLQKYRFCNIQREHDRVTIWIRENLRKPLRDSAFLIPIMTIARLINKIETLEALREPLVKTGWLASRDLMKLREIGQSAAITNSAYMVTTPEGMDKAAGLSFMIESVQSDMKLHTGAFRSLEELHQQLTKHPRIGSFLAAQVVADVKYTPRFQNIPDWWTFASSGPGSQRGLNRLLGRPHDSKWVEEYWRKSLTDAMTEAVPAMLKRGLPKLHAQDFQNCCCEFDKYERARLKQGEPKQLFKPHQPEPKQHQQSDLI
jgi:transposase